ncbi:hypothetical protein [Emticicia sp. SJ17W-69]|uniref:hypothetical protein n=1 Tax=Emticicia sp. SJ17W-69 TaxID=3421657 RepID=UPI003EBB4F3E
MKKTLIIYTLFIFSKLTAMAQSFDGNWYGQVQGTNGTLQAEMNLKTSTNQVNGQVIVSSNGAKELYTLRGNMNSSTVTGTLAYKDGTIFNFSMQLNKGKIQQNINYNGQVILQGNYTKEAKITIQNTPNNKPDGLYRDPNLVGKWTNQENYSSNGGFYGGSSTSIILNADGTIDDGGSSSYVSGPNSSGNSSGGGNSAIAQVKAAGAKWFTKGNILYWRVTVNGKTTDVANSKYYIERGALLLTDVNTGKKLLYYKGN